MMNGEQRNRLESSFSLLTKTGIFFFEYSRDVNTTFRMIQDCREGEAISWHLLELLKPKIPVKRAVFHEITRDAISRAFKSPRQLLTNLVQAQVRDFTAIF